MRPMLPEQAQRAEELTRKFPGVHGPPLHTGDPKVLGIADLARPDFGERVSLREGEVPVFWPCGVTTQVALENAGLDLAITHAPGCMFITDIRLEELSKGWPPGGMIRREPSFA